MNERQKKHLREAPGIMLYPGSRALFEALEAETVKRLLLAMIDFAAEGKEPEPQSAEERIAGAALRDHIQGDRHRYERKCLQNQYNRFPREGSDTWCGESARTARNGWR